MLIGIPPLSICGLLERFCEALPVLTELFCSLFGCGDIRDLIILRKVAKGRLHPGVKPLEGVEQGYACRCMHTVIVCKFRAG